MRCVRNGKVYERLLQLVEVSDCSDAGIARQLLEILENVGINRNFVVGQCYNGAASMSGHNNGVQKHIKDQYPSAIYTHCALHRLNLCIDKACNVIEIQANIILTKEISVFFSNSAKPLSLIQAQIENKCSKFSHLRLKKNCSTRWVENQEASLYLKNYIQQ